VLLYKEDSFNITILSKLNLRCRDLVKNKKNVH